MINIRKLAALDLKFLGPKIILAEFSLGVTGSMILGILTLRVAVRHSYSAQMIAFGVYLLLLGIDYVPLLLHAIDLVRHGGVDQEIADELGDRRSAFRKYRRQSLLLLIPLVVPAGAIVQQMRRTRTSQGSPT